MDYHCVAKVIIHKKSLKIKFAGCRTTYTQFTAFKCSELQNVLKKYKNLIIFDTITNIIVDHNKEKQYKLKANNIIVINKKELKIQFLKISNVPSHIFNIQ